MVSPPQSLPGSSHLPTHSTLCSFSLSRKQTGNQKNGLKMRSKEHKNHSHKTHRHTKKTSIKN